MSVKRMVGPGRLELPTSRLSGVRSNHLSYGPIVCAHGPTRLRADLHGGGLTGRRPFGLATLTRRHVPKSGSHPEDPASSGYLDLFL